MTTLKELQATAAEIGENLSYHTKRHERRAIRKSLLKETHIKAQLNFVKKHMRESMQKWKNRLFISFFILAIRKDAVFGRHQILRIPINTTCCETLIKARKVRR